MKLYKRLFPWAFALMTFTVTSFAVSANEGINGNPEINPNPVPAPTLTVDGYNVYFDNGSANWGSVMVHYWGGSSESEWPGAAMTLVSGSVYGYTVPDGTTGLVFNNGSGDQTADMNFISGHLYSQSGDQGEYGGSNPNPDPNPNPNPNPDAVTISGDYNLAYSGDKENVHYWGGTSQSEWPGLRMDTATGSDGKTYKVAKVADGTTGIVFNTPGGAQTGDLSYTASYVMDDNGATQTAVTFGNNPNPNPNPDPNPNPNPDPNPNPNPDPVIPSGDNLITDYYKVNPNGQVGTRKTISFTGHPATGAMSNWTEADLIAQGVARDVCQAFYGHHERPIVDSYALYGAYDDQNLYLGVQMVYTIWDLYGEGKQPGESKPYNMDGHIFWAFDLDPNKSFDGIIEGKTGPIWNEDQQGAKFANGVDAVLMCSTKPGVGTPGLFLPTPSGHASYNASYCKNLPSGFYGYADGLLPSITSIWGQASLDAQASALTGNEGFADLRGEIDDTAHTFYEFRIPLSLLGITADYIANTGIGVMYLDKYGSSPVGGTPYDPAYFDNVTLPYSQDPSSSNEKEDEDVITYAPARIGKMGAVSVNTLNADTENAAPEYFTLDGIRVDNPESGLYIVRRGSRVTKELIK